LKQDEKSPQRWGLRPKPRLPPAALPPDPRVVIFTQFECYF